MTHLTNDTGQTSAPGWGTVQEQDATNHQLCPGTISRCWCTANPPPPPPPNLLYSSRTFVAGKWRTRFCYALWSVQCGLSVPAWIMVQSQEVHRVGVGCGAGGGTHPHPDPTTALERAFFTPPPKKTTIMLQRVATAPPPPSPPSIEAVESINSMQPAPPPKKTVHGV